MRFMRPARRADQSVAIDKTEIRTPPLFIGCACDRNFVEPTATMLTSLDMNGTVPDATVILAGFGLDELDRATLKAGAGRLGSAMRFLEVTSDLLGGIDQRGYTGSYPPPVLGRLFLPDLIAVSGARLLTLDSDMVVRTSVRALAELELGDDLLAAAHDAPRDYDQTYFNSGLMLIDVDRYKREDVARRALGWLEEQHTHPTFPDQDALNHVVGARWHRLDRTWNYFCYFPLHFEAEDWDMGSVAHFAGPKPWNIVGHAGERLYYRYNAELHRRLTAAGVSPRFRRSPRIDAVLGWNDDLDGAVVRTPSAFIGCACDSGTVACTAALLTSIDLNGDLPGAEVLIAGFGLDQSDERRLRAAAGRRPLRFVDLAEQIARHASGAVERVPRSVLGRLFLPECVTEDGARLITFESAMVVNAALGPLVRRDFGANFFAAVPDQRGSTDRARFSVGLTMIDVDAYKFHHVAPRVATWIAEHGHASPWPDQDGLNETIGAQWYHLAQTWNFFAQAQVDPVAEDYETCNVARFVGTMPWDDQRHPGRRVYEAYAAASRAREEGRSDAISALLADRLPFRRTPAEPVDRDFIATCYEVFLGRELEDVRIAREREHLAPARAIASVVDCDEFRNNALAGLMHGRPLQGPGFRDRPSARQLYWIADRLPITRDTAEAVVGAQSWTQALTLVLSDERFSRTIGVERFPSAISARPAG